MPNERNTSIEKLEILVPVGLCLLVWIVFGQTLGHQFINFDDDLYVYGNTHINRGLTWSGLAWIWTHAHANLWHPLTSVSHMLDCSLFGLNASGHHFTNVVLHSIAVVLLFLVLSRMTGMFWQSAIVAAVFAIHPLRVESVAWVAERKDILSGIFLMLTLAAYRRYAQCTSLGRYLTMSILFACGLMSKATFVTVPALLLLFDYWPLHRADDARAWPRLIAEKIPLFALSAIASAATILAQGETVSSLAQLSLAARFNNAAVATINYIRQMFWPVDLGIFYPHPHNHLNRWLVFISATLIVLMSGVAILTRRKYPYIAVGWFWYLIMLAPVSGMMQAGLQGHADRFTYLPHIGLTILFVWLIVDLTKQWRHRTIILGVVGAFAITSWSVMSWRQTSFWHDSVSIWTHTLQVTSVNEIAERNLAAALIDRGKKDEAMVHSRAAAIAHWQTHLKDFPDDVAAHDDLGVLLVQSGDARGGIAQWQTSLQIDQRDGNAQNNLAWIFATHPDASIRDGAKAVVLAQLATQLPGGDQSPVILRTLAAAYAEKGVFAKAFEIAQRAADLATAQQNQSFAETLRHEIELYRANKPYRETPGR